MTLRDEVWDAVLMRLATTGSDGFKISELPFDESQRHTVRRVLKEMESLGYLSRESKRAKTWRPGDKFRLLSNSIEAREQLESEGK